VRTLTCALGCAHHNLFIFRYLYETFQHHTICETKPTIGGTIHIPDSTTPKYSLPDAMLGTVNPKLKPNYTIQDVAHIFDVTPRTILY
jgi:hypothetical protein